MNETLKLTEAEASNIISLSEKELLFGRTNGLMEAEGIEGNQIDPPTYNENYQDRPEDFEIFKYLFVQRALNRFVDYRKLFDEIDGLWTDFDCPDDMRTIVSFIPREDGGGSFELLKGEIERYCQAKRSRFASTRAAQAE